MTSRLALLGLGLVSLAACGHPEPTDASSPQFHAERIVGHEDITRYALALANEAMGAAPGYRFPEEAIGVKASASTNPVVRGNWATDAAEKVSEISLAEYYGLGRPGDLEMAYSPVHMDLHALRNYPRVGGRPQIASGRDTCLSAQARIAGAVEEALRSWPADEHRALFFLGHATHTIQDAFSEAHVRRSRDLRTIKQICTWEVSAPGVCKHKNWLGQDFDPADFVWRNPVTCPFRRTWDCLKDEAQAAAQASAGLLVTARALHEAGVGAQAARQTVMHFLASRTPTVGSGYMACDQMSD